MIYISQISGSKICNLGSKESAIHQVDIGGCPSQAGNCRLHKGENISIRVEFTPSKLSYCILNL